MRFADVQNQLNDLPRTFKRVDPTYMQWIDALSAGLFTMTSAIDGLVLQFLFLAAQFGWLDTWGTLVGVPRRSNESDIPYAARIQNTILARHSSPVAMLNWLLVIERLVCTLTENFPGVGYTISVPPTVTIAQLQQIINNLAVVRPAGVPFNISITTGGSFLNTVNYLGAAHVTGAYLAGSAVPFGVSIPSATNNSLSILPTLLITDPLINPPAT